MPTLCDRQAICGGSLSTKDVSMNTNRVKLSLLESNVVTNSILHISAVSKQAVYSSFTPHPHPALLQRPLSLSNVADPSTLSLSLSPSPILLPWLL